ncbi:MAG TPA: hypothetical protein VGR96_08005 [Acidobacteriaceae bacterium]|nr:hypothetical protein [Acidobacteriaceae bacterium]
MKVDFNVWMNCTADDPKLCVQIPEDGSHEFALCRHASSGEFTSKLDTAEIEITKANEIKTAVKNAVRDPSKVFGVIDLDVTPDQLDTLGFGFFALLQRQTDKQVRATHSSIQQAQTAS